MHQFTFLPKLAGHFSAIRLSVNLLFIKSNFDCPCAKTGNFVVMKVKLETGNWGLCCGCEGKLEFVQGEKFVMDKFGQQYNFNLNWPQAYIAATYK